ncbi:hypothetical protein W97_01658 [Coniosporium apollinis CBS 100218]|uniref:amidase n=1 Tax=Coniosporium apollinis (strain CBS 100218) TaxID=1168221 RepID=R7YLB7_CONA1|nr:uncharacterized protein W97_01658 [Coniosporium apollinis CBS 100218]EON62436.1 hypothetical protein W97_01658 [Coniosporium apollinis CBS 100218]
MSGKEKPQWEQISAAKRKALLASLEGLIPDPDILPPDSQLDVTSFPASSGWFKERELEITAASASLILTNIKGRTWSAEEVTRAFCKRAGLAHVLVNCLSETLFDEAIATAKSLDSHLNSTGETVGPLHGLPISLKDNFNIIGKDSTVGFVSWVNDPAKYNSNIVDLLRDAGAVLYVKTNVPTAMMIPETVNNVFGRTVNPLNRSLTSGGSSGGESALVAFGGSPLGVGTDIGGSLRIPAACTGIFTLRPSFGRFPTLRARTGLAGQEAVNSVNGPMGRTLEDIVLLSKVIVNSEPWHKDPKCLPIPWHPVEAKTKLKLGVLWDDGMAKPTPPVQRALKETVEKLKKAGHDIVDWAPDGHAQALGILGRMFVADGGKSIRKILEPVNEPWRPEMEYYTKAQELGVYDMWQLQLERSELCKQYLDRWHACDGLDAILAPTTPYASVENGKFKHVGYTGVYNILDYSAVSFPCGVTADKDLDQSTGEEPLGDMDAEVQNNYDAANVHGMPVSLQLIAKRLEEEKVLSMTETILKAL